MSAALLFMLALLAGCTDGPDRTAHAEVVAQFDSVTQVISVPGSPDDLVILQRDGLVLLWSEGQGNSVPILDLRDQVSTEGERGLAGFAFHPDFEENGIAYAAFSKTTGGPNDGKGGHSDVVQVEVTGRFLGSGMEVVDTLLRIDWVNWFHNIGGLKFGPDGMLYIMVGDGSEGLPAQDLNDLKGSLLRLDVSAGDGYSIPEDNPFVDVEDARGEIYLYGLRNSWRFDWDDQGDLYLAEVGSEAIEEVDLYREGVDSRNFGWPHYEGTQPWRDYGEKPTDVTWPIVEYTHDMGCAVIGGAVYDGDEFGDLHGKFIVADHCGSNLMITEKVDGEWRLTPWFELGGDRINSIDQAADGDLFISGFSGRVYQVVPGEA